jgi:hypothetical protein
MVIRSDVIEDLEVARVVAALDALAARNECSAEERTDIGGLIGRYRRLAARRHESVGSARRYTGGSRS